LKALNLAHGELLSSADLQALGSRLGADVPLFLRGGCLLMEGIGDKLSPLPALEGWVVILQPQMKLSTPQVYRRYDELDQWSSRKTSIIYDFVTRVNEHHRTRAVAAHLDNHLAPAAKALGAPVDALCGALREAGALGSSMTGSGSACYGVFEAKADAERAATALREELAFVAVAPLCAWGVQAAAATNEETQKGL
jgi:4-diphosphocytidyl-2-C-methyl-D-erythritol kinase